MKQTAWTKFLNWVLMALGFATTVSCVMYGPDFPNDAPMYGTPYADYEVLGKVVAEDGKPIEGIQVVGGRRDTTYTAADGSFLVEADKWDYPVAKFEDIDGPENGGEFKTKIEEFDLSKFKKVEEGSGWYRGKFVAEDVVVTMEKK